MFRKEFVSAITSTGMLTLKELRPYTINKDPDIISELDLIRHEGLDVEKLGKLLAEKNGLQFIDLSNAKISPDAISSIKKSIMTRYRVVPIQKKGQVLTLATFDPTVKNKQDELKSVTRHNVNFILTTMKAWNKIYNEVEESIDDLVNSIREVNEDKGTEDKNIKEEDIGDDVISFVNRILAESFVKKASDIHIEPYEKVFRVRLRIDGKLFKVSNPPKALMNPIISRLKIMAKMDISEKRKPQDGRIKLIIAGKPIDYRVSSLPTLFGEKIVLRLLDSSNLELDMTKLGFEKDQLQVFQDGIHKPYGMCLVTGPTGSGKTTTLYSALADLNKPTSNISTAEDPVEFNLEGINQVNVKREVGLDFAAALKSFLRQDPDIIMVGEIRDGELGEIAVEAALTGHMVLSTLHTNDAPATVTRLLQMGIEPFLLVAALNVVVAQRLCRRICPNCKVVDTDVTPQQLMKAGFAEKTAHKLKVYKGEGCNRCNNMGYKGRVAIYEVLHVTAGIREKIVALSSTDEVKKQAIKDGMKTLRMCALTKVAEGLTTLEEALSNSSSDK